MDCQKKASMYHSVWLYEMYNSCKSVFPNNRPWEQQEINEIKKQTKKVKERYETKKNGHKIKCPDNLSLPNQNTIIIIIIIIR